jgi:hypothetical protein
MTDTELKYFVALQPKIREAMGEWQEGDWASCPKIGQGVKPFPIGGRSNSCPTCSFLPLPIDPRNPERGLWGMVDWDLFSTLTPRDGEWYVFGMNDRRTKGFCSEWCTPTLALLKALAWQEGV